MPRQELFRWRSARPKQPSAMLALPGTMTLLNAAKAFLRHFAKIFPIARNRSNYLFSSSARCWSRTLRARTQLQDDRQTCERVCAANESFQVARVRLVQQTWIVYEKNKFRRLQWLVFFSFRLGSIKKFEAPPSYGRRWVCFKCLS